ncbi:MAG: alanine--tRNA ligase [Verrucomicrobiota bacterium]|nr:alanine--tRNA ligase [Verrucomicrobiota bacterium]
MTSKNIRKKYLDFFKSRSHAIIDSASLLPENDPTVLFTTAGMHPLVSYLLGEKHPAGAKLANVQKCIRTGDIEEVGDDVHLTFFEMLGNWSLGEYFKKEAISYSYEFLTGKNWLNIPVENLAVSVFAGDDDAPFDEEAYNCWLKLGMSAERIAKLGKKDNWWGPAGQTGPCGPDTEMFCWNGDGNPPEKFDPENASWVEIWNDVFMQYNKTTEGNFEPLLQKNVDTGMGLERVTAILQNKKNCYETELFQPIFRKIEALAGKKQNLTTNTEAKIVAEHMRAATFILADGVAPSNVDSGYILRRLIRRTINKGRKLGINGAFTFEIASVVIEEYCDIYPELKKQKKFIEDELSMEEEQFAETLKKGLKEFNKIIDNVPDFVRKKSFNGKKAFFLYETYGFPLELTVEMAEEKGFSVDKKGFEKAYKKHQEMSRKGAENKFKGGLADDSEQTARLHTATHLLHQTLRDVLGDHVEQRGSNITAKRLRFDFSHPEKMTIEEKTKVETIINSKIAEALEVKDEEMSIEEAKKVGAIGIFESKYGDRVKVYSIGNYSKEICGGPHCKNTTELGTFKIKKEQSSSRGIRRIKAILN